MHSFVIIKIITIIIITYPQTQEEKREINQDLALEIQRMHRPREERQ